MSGIDSFRPEGGCCELFKHLSTTQPFCTLSPNSPQQDKKTGSGSVNSYNFLWICLILSPVMSAKPKRELNRSDRRSAKVIYFVMPQIPFREPNKMKARNYVLQKNQKEKKSRAAWAGSREMKDEPCWSEASGRRMDYWRSHAVAHPRKCRTWNRFHAWKCISQFI